MANQQPHDSYLKLHGKANSTITPATFKRGVINTIHPNGTADVQLIGNNSTILKGLYFSSAVNPHAVKTGDKCRIDMFSEINPSDSVIAYIYGRQITTSQWGFYTLSYNTGTSINFTIPHTLGVLPTFASVSAGASFHSVNGSYITFGLYVSNTGPNNVPFDSSFIYATLETNAGSNFSTTIFWFATCA